MKANIEKAIQKRRPRKQAAAAERVFIVNETYGGTLKLPDIFSDLLCAEYCRKEQNIHGSDFNH
jgi:hypothetical protein